LFFSGVTDSLSELSSFFSEVLELSSDETDFFFKNSCFLLAFRFTEEGLSFFLTTLVVMASPLVSREKVKLEPMEMENLKALPWVSRCRQKSKHWVARVAHLFPMLESDISVISET